MESSGAGQDAAAVAALLDSLLQQAAPHVRPATEEEQEEEITAQELRQRQTAEALLNLGDLLCKPEFRQAHGANWAPLALALDRWFVKVLSTCPDEERAEYWDGDNSMLRSRLESRPAAVAALVAASLGCGGSLGGKVGQIEGLLSILVQATGGRGQAAKLAELQATLRAEMGPVASSRRPALACDLARFDASWPAPGGGASSAAASGADDAAPAAGMAVAEARCEVRREEEGDTLGDAQHGSVAAGGDLLAFVGTAGYKQRGPYLAAGRIRGASGGGAGAGAPAGAGGGSSEQGGSSAGGGKEALWQQSLKEVDTGLYERGCRVAVDPVRELVWTAGGESRIKGFAIGEAGRDACRYTLRSATPDLLGVLGGRVLAAAKHGVVEWWDISRLTPHRQWVSAREWYEVGHWEMEEKYGTQVLDPSNSDWNDDEDADDAEATAGDVAHGQMRLVEPEAAGAKCGVVQLLPLGAVEGDAPPQQVVGSVQRSASVWVWDWPTGSLAGLLTGHTGVISDVSTSPGLPHLVAAGSWGATCRIWDLRSPGPCTHVLSSKSSLGVAALALADYQGQPYCFSSCRNDEAILCWDLRMRQCLYELATGNTDVCTLQWHAPTSSLFASTDCDYRDRLGGRYGYGALEGVRWPRCAHKPSDFPRSWDARDHLLICYAFKEAPGRGTLPS